MKKAVIALGTLMLAGTAWAKLPPPSDEAKAKAAEAKAKADWGNKVAAYKLCQRQDKIAAQVHKSKGGKPTAAATPCQDPGPFVAAPAAAAPAAGMVAAAPASAAKPAASAKPMTSAKK